MTVQSVDRAISLLETIAGRPCNLVQAAERSDLPVSTAARLLATLEARGVVRRDGLGTYVVGPLVQRLRSPDTDIPSIQAAAHREMADLVDRIGEATALSIPIGAETLTVAQVDVPRPVRAEDWTGHRWDITAGGSGIVMMSTWTPDEVDALLEVLPDARQAEIRREIRRARDRGAAWSHGTHVDDLSSVAAPVRGAGARAVAALIVYGPSYRFPSPDAEAGIERRVADAAARVTERLVD